ncbi:MAG: WD40/YVTN/BNR-like repeat-containing protein, partial [Flavobacteriales bacterium]
MNRILLLLALAAVGTNGLAQRNRLAPTSATERLSVNDQRASSDAASWTAGLDLRCVGPTVMSGRVVDIAVDSPDGRTFYVAYASGGLWRTVNHGTSFEPLFDDALTITLGAIAVHPETGRIWAGTGEVNSSRSSYAGTGMYTSDDGGETWRHAGLADA